MKVPKKSGLFYLNSFMKLEKQKRKFLPENLVIDSWEKIEEYFLDLSKRQLNSVKELEKWMIDRSELDAVLSEDLGWRYIRMTCDTTNQALSDSYNFFISEIEPKVAPYNNEFNKKMIESKFVNELDKEKYKIYLRGVKKSIEIFREKNIPLFTEIQTETPKFGNISSKMTVEMEGKEITLQMAANYLKSPNRDIRKEAFDKVQNRRAQDRNDLDDLFTKLLKLRNQVAENAQHKNFRDYMFDALGRFDYSVQDCFNFHESIEKEIVPIAENFDKERKKEMQLDALRPWDMDVDTTGKPPIKPFQTGEELTQKSIECFSKVRPFYGECLKVMNEMKHLDLESKKGKAPGGYNYPLYESGVPFIFMNSVGSLRDLVTMVHEGGHAIHSILTRDLELTDFKNIPSEVAELASMSMELISMEHWDVFFSDEEELKRAKREHLEDVLSTLPWIATVDKFQHWIYENPNHSIKEREDAWVKIFKQFSSSVVDWSGYEEAFARRWQNQLHIFEVPLYYIEYGMAQLGAIAMWRNYKQNPKKALDGYEAALKLGYTKSISEIYSSANIKFDFSREYVKELAEFVKGELNKLN